MSKSVMRSRFAKYFYPLVEKLNQKNFKSPKKNQLKILTEKLTVLDMKLPEEQICLDAIEKYRLYRETIMKNL